MQIITNQFQKELKKHGSDHFPFLVSYQCLSEYDSNSFMWHCHPEIEITYVKEGSMHYRINNRSFHLKEGDIIFCNSNALHSGEMENQEDCSYIPITFDPKLIYGFFQSTICTRYVDPVIQNLAVLITVKNGTKLFVTECWKSSHSINKSRISMNWIFPFGCSSCGGCLWNTFRISLYQLLLISQNTNESAGFSPTSNKII